MSVTVRRTRSGDGAGIAEAWLSSAAYYADLDPEHFQVPRAEGLAEGWEKQLGQDSSGSLQLVAEADRRVIGWLSARIELRRRTLSRSSPASMAGRGLQWTR